MQIFINRFLVGFFGLLVVSPQRMCKHEIRTMGSRLWVVLDNIFMASDHFLKCSVCLIQVFPVRVRQSYTSVEKYLPDFIRRQPLARKLKSFTELFQTFMSLSLPRPRGSLFLESINDSLYAEAAFGKSAVLSLQQLLIYLRRGGPLILLRV